jgi:hypothetical protein
MVFAVQRCPVSGQLLDMVVDGVDQGLCEATGFPAPDEMRVKPAELGEIRRDRLGPRFSRAPAHLLVVPSLRGRAVLCLRHGTIESSAPARVKLSITGERKRPYRASAYTRTRYLI